jgi:rhodanese-related sulfurtransferase
MSTLAKIATVCVAFLGLVGGYAEDIAAQHAIQGKERHETTSLTPKRAFELIEKNKHTRRFVVLDIRTPQEFEGGHIEGAINIDYHSSAFLRDLDGLDKSNAYFVYCRTGRRTTEAIRIMVQKGFRNIYRTSGDIVAWRAEGFPLVKGAGKT